MADSPGKPIKVYPPKPLFHKAPLAWIKRTWSPPPRPSGKKPRMATMRTARKVISTAFASSVTTAAAAVIGALTGPDLVRGVEAVVGELPRLAEVAVLAAAPALLAAADFFATRLVGRRTHPDPQDELEANE